MEKEIKNLLKDIREYEIYLDKDQTEYVRKCLVIAYLYGKGEGLNIGSEINKKIISGSV
jgi:hypothetical protein